MPGRKNVGLSRKVILALADGPKTFRELREIVKDVPKTTLSGVLCYLLRRGEVKRRKVRRRVGRMFRCPECGHVFWNSRWWMYVYEYYIPRKAPERPAGHHDSTARLLCQDALSSSTDAGTAGLARDRPKKARR